MSAIAALLLAAAPTPVLVELFTSEGCSSCPSADEALAWLEQEQPVAGIEVIALSLHVDYWNQLGWADPYASARFTARQQAYGNDVYTPQMIIDGDTAFVGGKGRAVAALAERRGEARAAIRLSTAVKGDAVEVSVTSESTAPLWVALTESGLSHEVTRGENRGRTLSHTAVVRHFVRVENGKVTLPLEATWNRAHLKVVAFNQEKGPGRVLGVAAKKL